MYFFVLICLWLIVTINNEVKASPVNQRRHQQQQQSFNLNQMETLFSFGDSYTTEYLDLPTMTYPDSDKVSSTNGPNWVHYFTKVTQLKDWDLAYNSAPIQNELVNQNSSVIDVSQQIEKLFPKYFLKTETQNYDPEKTLYDIWVGINDLTLILDNKSPPLMDTLMRRFEELIAFLYNDNAKYVVLINVPPIDRSPKFASKDNASHLKSLVKEYNQALEEMAVRVSKNKSLYIFLIDAWSIFTDMLDHPNNYGFKNVTGYCSNWRKPTENDCLPIMDYFWLNDLHPTTRVHAQLAEKIQTTLEKRNL